MVIILFKTNTFVFHPKKKMIQINLFVVVVVGAQAC